MSMSQEEIEALMNGLEIDDESSSSQSAESVKVNTQEIEELLSQTEDYKKEEKTFNIKEESLIDESEDISEAKLESFVKTDEIEQLLNDIESSSLNKQEDIEYAMDELDSIEAFEEEIVPAEKSKKDSRSEDDIAKDWTSSRIEEGIFPLPAERDTKVVNQLNQVAND